MSYIDYNEYYQKLIVGYAKEHVEAGNWDESESIQKSKESIERLLPNGLETPDQYLFSIVEEETNEKIGIFWIAIQNRAKKSSFIYDIRIDEKYQHQGYGKKTFQHAEAWLKTLNVKKVALHVFGTNTVARNLYQKLGFIETDIQMVKEF
jgi:RimJ/RimL family protein N-acetyltransferase